MSISDLVTLATNKENFLSLENYIEFCERFLDFASSGLQAVIVSQNEPNYRFYQYRQDGYFNISRPINSSNSKYDPGYRRSDWSKRSGDEKRYSEGTGPQPNGV